MRKPAVVAVLIIAAACTDHTPITPDLGGPSASISDAVHEDGNAHFYFLPPLVVGPLTSGIFDESLLPFIVVEVCRVDPTGCTSIAHFTATSTATCGPKDATPPASGLLRVVAEDEVYIVNWDTGECPALDPTSTYRITVLVAGTELGHADLDVLDNGAGLRNVDTEEFVGLVDGRTLPIKFRIEEGAVFVVGAAGGTIVAAAGQVILRIPENALASAVGITVKPGGTVSWEEGTIPGTLWEFGPNGTEFTVPGELTITYDPDALPPDLTDPATSLMLATRVDDEWVESPSTVDATAGVARGPVFGFSQKAVVEKTASIDVSPSAAILAPGEGLALASSARSARGAPLVRRALLWSSANSGVAAVDRAGRVTAIAPGIISVSVSPRVIPSGIDPCSLPFVLCTFPLRSVSVTVRLPVGFNGDFVGTMTPNFRRKCFLPVADCSPPNARGPVHATLHLDNTGTRVLGQLDAFGLIPTLFLVDGRVDGDALLFGISPQQLVGISGPPCPGFATFPGGTPPLIGEFTCVFVSHFDSLFLEYDFNMLPLR